MSIIKDYFMYFLILVYICGSIGFVLNPNFFSPFTPFTLILTALVYLIHQPIDYYRFIIAFLTMAFLGYCFEVIGVRTGLIFGHYHYGDNLGYKILQVPIVISFNWALMITSGVIVCSRLLKNKYAALALSSLMVTLIDVLIEQVAFKLDFWMFEGGMPGIHNYLGWLVISFILPLPFYKDLIRGNDKISSIFLLLQMIFFGTIYIFV